MKLRKALVFVLCAVLALPLAACSKGSTGGKNPVDKNKTFTVTFDVGTEARANGVTDFPTQTYKYGETLVYYPTPKVWEGHTFDGWFDGNNQLVAEAKITRNWNVKARWIDESAANEAAQAYESNISSWDEDGHLYIHYKRSGHSASDEDKTYNDNGPLYDDPDKAIKNDRYGDWALWLWPTDGETTYQGTKYSYEGIVFFPAKIDASGAVYDIKLDNIYEKGGWNENTRTHKGLTVSYLNQSNKSMRSIMMQLFQYSSRAAKGFWKNDGDNNGLDNEKMKRVVNGKTTYHWFVSEGSVPYGSAKFSGKEVVDNYKDDPDRTKHPTDRDLSNPLNINSNNATSYNINDVPVADYNTTGVGYQIFLASFRDGKKDDEFTTKGKGMGDLRGVIDALEEGYFDALNVDVLWLTPFQTSTNYHGYDIKDYFSVDPRFGTIDDYRELLFKAHQKGIKVVMDFVLNHTAQGNPWFIKSSNLETERVGDKTIDYRNFYTWITKAQYDKIPGSPDKLDDNGKPNPNYNPVKAQWFEDSHGYYFYSSFGSSMPELNYDYQPVRDAILDVCKYWMAFGLDGFRCDAVKHIYMKNEIQFSNGGDGEYVFEEGKTADTDPYTYDVKRNMHFWSEFNYKLKKEYPNAFIVGENLDGDPKNVEKFFAGMDSQFDFNSYYDAGRSLINSDNSANSGWAGAIKSYLKSRDGETPRSLGNKHYNANYINGQFTSNHDLPRARDRMNATTDGTNDNFHSFFNDTGKLETINDKPVRVYDDYSTTPTKTDITETRATRSDNLLRLYYAYLMTIPGIAWIYNGDELGMTGIMNCIIEGGSANSSNATSHEDRVYRQPMKWFDDVSANASYDIGFNNYKCELVGLNTTQYVHGYDVQKTDKTSIYSWMKTLTQVRNDHPELINGQVQETYTTISNNGSVALSAYTVKGATGTTKVYISTGGAYNASGEVYASWSSGKYSVTICKG